MCMNTCTDDEDGDDDNEDDDDRYTHMNVYTNTHTQHIFDAVEGNVIVVCLVGRYQQVLFTDFTQLSYTVSILYVEVT